jgi:hypothetical protein
VIWFLIFNIKDSLLFPERPCPLSKRRGDSPAAAMQDFYVGLAIINSAYYVNEKIFTPAPHTREVL